MLGLLAMSVVFVALDALGSAMDAETNVQVTLALQYLQKYHIAHRDVRSDNLLLNASGIVKLVSGASTLSFFVCSRTGC